MKTSYFLFRIPKSNFRHVAVQSEEAPAINGIAIQVSWIGFPAHLNQAFRPSVVDDLVTNLSEKSTDLSIVWSLQGVV